MNPIKLVSCIAMISLSLTGCANFNQHYGPGDPDDQYFGRDHPNTGDTHYTKTKDHVAPYRITMNSRGEIVVLDRQGKEIPPNAGYPVKVKASYIESIESVTIVRYRGSPEYDVVEAGGKTYHIPVAHTH
ncbi:hypothetical protein [Hahella ganghwensis]|uniref:hypothetical protein n=1 Tax=Hahella ganghwensis TaxID=286420 RepID=UPI0003690B34|nr:hypothetical protein [Hahella ganghwensis]